MCTLPTLLQPFFSKVALGSETTPSFNYYVSIVFLPLFVSEASPQWELDEKVCIVVHGHIYE